MKSTPALILRNCALWVNEDVKVGQMSEVTIPAFKVKTEGLRNAGMVKERQVSLGYETDDLKFKMTAMDPATVTELTGKPGYELPFMITGALADEDGTMTNATLYLRGFMKSFDFGTWKPGDKAESSTNSSGTTSSWTSAAKPASKPMTSTSASTALAKPAISAPHCCCKGASWNILSKCR